MSPTTAPGGLRNVPRPDDGCRRAGAALLGVGAPAASAAEVCGMQAATQPLIDHVKTAHLERSPLQHVKTAHVERSPLQQVQDLIDADEYVLAHTVLVESMPAPVLEGCGAPPAPTMPPAHGGTPPPAVPPPPQSAPTPAPPAPTQTVEIHNYAYSPKDITVGAGTSVT